MNMFLTYILKVSLLTAAFVLLYNLLLRRDTSYGKNRRTLLLSLVLSYILPLCVITVHRPVPEPMTETTSANYSRTGTEAYDAHTNANPENTEALTSEENNLWNVTVLCIYLTGIVIIVSSRLLSLRKVIKIIKDGKVYDKGPDYTVIISLVITMPFNWMKYIVIPETIKGEQLKEDSSPETSWKRAVISHEISHARHHHSREMLITDFLSVFQWFNPAVWVLRRNLSDIHEFQADADVLDSGYDLVRYQQHLFDSVVKRKKTSVTTGFGESSLKARMIMMSLPHSKTGHLIKYIYVPLLTVVSICLMSNVEYDRTRAADINGWHEGYSFSIINNVAVLTGYDKSMAGILGTIPETVEHEGKKYTVRVIGPAALSGTGIRNLVIPEGITEISAQAFAWSGNLESVTIPSTVSVIGTKAFDKCVNLKYVYLNDGPKSLPDGIFLDCRNLESVRLPSTLENIGDGAFSDCRNLKEITFPRKLRRIGNEAFFRCVRLTSIQLPKRLKYIGDGAFYGCRSLEPVNTGRLRATIGNKVFYSEK